MIHRCGAEHAESFECLIEAAVVECNHRLVEEPGAPIHEVPGMSERTGATRPGSVIGYDTTI